MTRYYVNVDAYGRPCKHRHRTLEAAQYCRYHGILSYSVAKVDDSTNPKTIQTIPWAGETPK